MRYLDTKLMKGSSFVDRCSKIASLTIGLHGLRVCTLAELLLNWRFWTPGSLGVIYDVGIVADVLRFCNWPMTVNFCIGHAYDN